MAMMIIMNDNKDDNDDYVDEGALCTYFPDDDGLHFVFVSQNTFQVAHRTNVAHSTWHAGLIFAQCTKVAHYKKFYTSHNCTQQTIAQCAWLSGAHSCTALRAREPAQKYFQTIHLISISLKADALSFVYQFKQF